MVKISGTVIVGSAFPRSTVVVLFGPPCLHSFLNSHAFEANSKREPNSLCTANTYIKRLGRPEGDSKYRVEGSATNVFRRAELKGQRPENVVAPRYFNTYFVSVLRRNGPQ